MYIGLYFLYVLHCKHNKKIPDSKNFNSKRINPTPRPRTGCFGLYNHNVTSITRMVSYKDHPANHRQPPVHRF
ncbi:hypothetical protein DW107_07490 [Tannerella sp. AM09-19]|nr:hypothetical protein DW107_07490 [Tannerella sp. AM09-19]